MPTISKAKKYQVYYTIDGVPGQTTTFKALRYAKQTAGDILRNPKLELLSIVGFDADQKRCFWEAVK